MDPGKVSGGPRVRPMLLVVVAHPDDESFGCGSVIAGSAARGWNVVVCCASRGEAGEDATGRHSTPEALAVGRETELRVAAADLGATGVELLGFADSGWDGPSHPGAIVENKEAVASAVAATYLRHRPDVVVAMDPSGSDGHRDHAAIGAAATEAFREVVDWPATLYHWCLPRSLMELWGKEIAGRNPDSVYLGTELGRPDADITTVVDAAEVLDLRWRAIGRHETQSSPYDGISPKLAEAFVARDHLIRVEPPWTGGSLEEELLAPAAAVRARRR